MAVNNFTYGLVESYGKDNSTDGGLLSHVFMASLMLIWLPGVLSNSLALFFIVLDIKRITLPLLVLLMALISSDLLAVNFSLVRHLLIIYVTPAYGLCASVSFLHAFFKMTAGCVNSLMATDRVLAVCAAYFYAKHVTVKTWKIGCCIAVVIMSLCSALPLVGLGSVMSVADDGSLECAAFYADSTTEKTFPFVFSILGFCFVGVIVTCNTALVIALVKLNKRKVVLSDTAVCPAPPECGDATFSQENETTGGYSSKSSKDQNGHFITQNGNCASSSEHQVCKQQLSDNINMPMQLQNGTISSEEKPDNGTISKIRFPKKVAFEIAFAKLMFCFAAAYLLCGSPNYVSYYHGLSRNYTITG